MTLTKDAEKRIEELQILEQQLQHFLMEKQTMQVELNEAENAISELKKTNDEVYKIIGEVMLKSDKDKLIKELEEKKKILGIRINSVEKQEKLMSSKTEEIRTEIQTELSEKKS